MFCLIFLSSRCNINTLNKIYKKNQDGKYIIDGKLYNKLYGSREDVWDGIAYKTTGKLLKCDFTINKFGKIISKKKCIQEKIIKRFEKFGVNKSSDTKELFCES